MSVCWRIRAQRGQATVELALVMPVVVLILMCIVQVGVVLRQHLVVTHAARAGARAAAVAPTLEVAHRAVMASAPLDPQRTVVRLRHNARTVTVTVVHSAATDVPLVGAFVGDVALEARSTFRRE